MIKKITFGNSNCYLVNQNGNFMLIDTELPDKSKELIIELKANGVTNHNFKIVVLTHGHIDHVGNALALREYFGVKIAIGKDDLEMIKNGDLTFPKAHNIFSKILRSFLTIFLTVKNKKLTYQFFEADFLLNDKDNLEQFDIDGKVISLSGHTLGSIGIVVNEDLFVGDAAMIVRGKLIAPIFGESEMLMQQAISKMSAFSLDKIHTGH